MKISILALAALSIGALAMHGTARAASDTPSPSIPPMIWPHQAGCLRDMKTARAAHEQKFGPSRSPSVGLAAKPVDIWIGGRRFEVHPPKSGGELRFREYIPGAGTFFAIGLDPERPRDLDDLWNADLNAEFGRDGVDGVRERGAERDPAAVTGIIVTRRPRLPPFIKSQFPGRILHRVARCIRNAVRIARKRFDASDLETGR